MCFLIKFLWIASLWFIIDFVALMKADIFPECESYDNGEYISSPRDCNLFIYCDGENSQEGPCPDGLHFSAAERACTSPEEANCRIGQPEEPVNTEPEEEDTPTTATTQATTEKSLATSSTTTITSTTMASTSSTTTTTTTESTTTTLATTTAMAVVTEIESIMSTPFITKGLTLVLENCPQKDEVNRVILLPHKQSCSGYYLCHSGQAIEMYCSQRLHFNKKTGKCDFPEKVGCELDRPSRDQCGVDVVDFFPHAGNCNYFFYCIRGFLTLQQCPFLYGWDTDRRTCVILSKAKCYQNSKRVSSNLPSMRHFL